VYRKKSLDTNRPPSSASSGEGSPGLLSSPKLASRLGTAAAAPWQKYNPSPSHASPSAGILKRKSIDDSISSAEVRKILIFAVTHIAFTIDDSISFAEVRKVLIFAITLLFTIDDSISFAEVRKVMIFAVTLLFYNRLFHVVCRVEEGYDFYRHSAFVQSTIPFHPPRCGKVAMAVYALH
jgi:hypothetical protein